MSSPKKTIACLGATGGCVGASLAMALKAGHHCTALARTPEKLRDFLITQHNILPTTLSQYLTIYQGDAKVPADVSKILVNPHDDRFLVDVILSGIGAYPTFQWSIKTPLPLTDPTICESAIAALYAAISTLASSSSITGTLTGNKPLLIVISTSGAIGKRGIPWYIIPLYNYLLSSPLADKLRMEQMVRGDNGEHMKSYVIIRPSVLTGGEARGDSALRISWEWGSKGGDDREQEPSPQPGLLVSKKDVGSWIFRKAIVEGGWDGKCVTLVY